MNTSALYIFSINDNEQLPLFSPYYGDPRSVTERFLRMQYNHCLESGYAMQFVKANADVEFARDYNVVSDYIYTLNYTGLLQAAAYRRTGQDIFFEGAWQDFIDQYDGLVL